MFSWYNFLLYAHLICKNDIENTFCFVNYLWLLTICYKDSSHSIIFYPMVCIYYHNCNNPSLNSTILEGILIVFFKSFTQILYYPLLNFIWCMLCFPDSCSQVSALIIFFSSLLTMKLFPLVLYFLQECRPPACWISFVTSLPHSLRSPIIFVTLSSESWRSFSNVLPTSQV